ncbi:MAG: hypothetical protein Q4A54_09960, partial [Parabacteroides sp.]|nr:hypothetical protein [Parabacteroides sp.]
ATLGNQNPKGLPVGAVSKQNVCSHSLRKTFGFWVYHQAKDKDGALIILQEIFKHSSPAITSRYIGLTDNEISEELT